MGIAKKGTRLICVDQVKYRWVARNVAPVGFRITVQGVNPPGSVLVLRCMQDRAVAHVPPSQVAGFIDRARREGWVPQKPGPLFEVEVTV